MATTTAQPRTVVTIPTAQNLLERVDHIIARAVGTDLVPPGTELSREQLLHVALMRGIEAIDAMVRDEEHRAAAERATH